MSKIVKILCCVMLAVFVGTVQISVVQAADPAPAQKAPEVVWTQATGTVVFYSSPHDEGVVKVDEKTKITFGSPAFKSGEVAKGDIVTFETTGAGPDAKVKKGSMEKK